MSTTAKYYSRTIISVSPPITEVLTFDRLHAKLYNSQVLQSQETNFDEATGISGRAAKWLIDNWNEVAGDRFRYALVTADVPPDVPPDVVGRPGVAPEPPKVESGPIEPELHPTRPVFIVRRNTDGRIMSFIVFSSPNSPTGVRLNSAGQFISFTFYSCDWHIDLARRMTKRPTRRGVILRQIISEETFESLRRRG